MNEHILWKGAEQRWNKFQSRTRKHRRILEQKLLILFLYFYNLYLL